MVSVGLQYYDFGNNIGYIINSTAKAFVRVLDSQLMEKVGVTAGQWKVLAVLVDRDGRTQKEIAERLALDGATLIPVIDKMEKDNLVVRKIDPADRRNNRIYRTATDLGSGEYTLMLGAQNDAITIMKAVINTGSGKSI
jgi:MarR family transcriptional regulator, transcriptional regulator for hemolysin